MSMTNNNHTLVVEGGAMRGIFAAGVLDEFLDQGYQPFNRYFGAPSEAPYTGLLRPILIFAFSHTY